jgi:hypothetical protein
MLNDTTFFKLNTVNFRIGKTCDAVDTCLLSLDSMHLVPRHMKKILVTFYFAHIAKILCGPYTFNSDSFEYSFFPFSILMCYLCH